MYGLNSAIEYKAECYIFSYGGVSKCPENTRTKRTSNDTNTFKSEFHFGLCELDTITFVHKKVM